MSLAELAVMQVELQHQHDEITRLRAEFAQAKADVARLQSLLEQYSPGAPTHAELKADAARLREALVRIAEGDCSVPGLSPEYIGHARKIAREALAATEPTQVEPKTKL